MDSSEFLAFLHSRSSVREFHPAELAPSQIDAILAAASRAPSAGNLEAWDVVVVTDAEIRGELSEAALSQPHIAEAPAVFVVCANYVRSMSRYGERGILYAVQDATIAAAFMMLAAHAENLGACWTGAFDEEEVRGILQLPRHIRPIVLLAVGRPRALPAKTPRMPLAEHVHREVW
ncbi:MAG: nitroreductase family protein [Methanomicrobiales archaeon]|nr:nitroreductase family protein [Methanomicrobiales archaeon]MDI6875694.1 nitroreductase family protein [Methanomicrobiales archaeon]